MIVPKNSVLVFAIVGVEAPSGEIVGSLVSAWGVADGDEPNFTGKLGVIYCHQKLNQPLNDCIANNFSPVQVRLQVDLFARLIAGFLYRLAGRGDLQKRVAAEEW